ncbi:MAG TPA: response regulator [Kofleriaceae bacterium]
MQTYLWNPWSIFDELERSMFAAGSSEWPPFDSTNPTYPIRSCDPCPRPVAYVSLQETADRERIASVLERAGWTVVLQPSGFHLIQAIAGIIDGHEAGLHPCLIVVDARSRGCTGTTIAAGLRDLGITIPIVLIAAPGEALPVSTDQSLRIVDSASAAQAVADLAAGAPGPVS